MTGPGPDGGSGDRRMPRQAMGFQPEAFAIELRPLPAAARSTLYLLLLLIVTALAGAVTALAGAYLAEVDRIVVGRGRLVTQSPTIVVQPLETSIIRSIEVDVGQLVTRGQRLATMNPTMVEADLQTVRLRLASYDAEVARLRAELNGTPVEQALPGNAPAAVLQREVYRQRQGRYQAELAAADEVVRRLEASRRTKAATVNWLQERIAALREIVEMRRTLMEGNVGSRLQWLTAQNDLIEAAGTLERTNNELHEVDHELAEKQARRESFIGQWRGEAIEAEVTARRERDRLAEDLHRQELRSRMVELTAPFDAVVLKVANRSVGSVLREAEVLFRLVPVDVPLRVDIEIDASDIAHVRAGDTVRCKFEALPFQRHGTVPGRITAITEDTLQREERQANRIVYVAHAEFDGHPALRDVPADFRLIPGMTAVVEIKTGTRRVLDYFLYPLLRGLDEGLREP